MRLTYISVVLIILLPILIFFFTRGVITHDEGYILHSSEKILHGLLPYRDFHFVYTPLSLFMTAFSLAIFPSILSTRILMLLITILSCLLIYRIVILSTNNKTYALFAILLYVSWGPTHINFVWPVNFAIPTALLAINSLLNFSDKRSIYFLFFAGIFSFSVFLAKQNFGIALIFPVITFFLVKSYRNFSYPLTFIYGYIWGIILFCIYLLLTGSFSFFVTDFYTYTYKRIIVMGSLDTPFIYYDKPLKVLIRTGIYLIPIGVSIAAFILLIIRKRFRLLFIPAFVASFYVVGIRPTTDYVHLTPLLSLCGLPISLLLRYNISSTIKLLIYTLLVVLIFLGFQTALFNGYYKWDQPLIYQNYFYGDSKVLLFINDQQKREFLAIKRLVARHTIPSDYIYINSYTPIFYFVADRIEPTKYNYLHMDVDSNIYYNNLKGSLIGKEVKLIFIKHDSFANLPIKEYIKSNYKLLNKIGDNDVYIRNR